MLFDPDSLLVGPRGRRSCFELATSVPEVHQVAFYAAHELGPRRGRSRMMFGPEVTPPPHAPADVAAVIDGAAVLEPDADALLRALAGAVDAARYWQEPDGEDVLAATPELRGPLARVARGALTAWKRTDDLAFLSEDSSVPLQQTLRHQHTAYANFFAGRAKYPRFKSRNGKQSAHYTRSAFRLRDGTLTLAKHQAPLEFVWSWDAETLAGLDPTMVVVSREPDGRWYVTFAVDTDEPEPAEPTGNAVGVDLGVKDFAVLSTGETIAKPEVPGPQGPQPQALPAANGPQAEGLEQPPQSQEHGGTCAPQGPPRSC